MVSAKIIVVKVINKMFTKIRLLQGNRIILFHSGSFILEVEV